MSSTEQDQMQFGSKPKTSRTSSNSCEKTMQQPNVYRRAAGSNWLAATVSGSDNKVQVAKAAEGGTAPDSEHPSTKSARTRQRKMAQRNRYLAMDCEMVGVGHNGQEDMLARVSIVNSAGHVLLDKHVKPRHPVTDYRTSVSGIRPHDIENAEDFATVQNEVVKMIHGKILVGHALRNDLAVLNIKHPFEQIRDTSRYKPLCKLVSNGHTPSLKRLTMAVLGQEIQTGEHNSVEDARSAMGIYNRIAADWEKYLEKKQLQQQRF
ncbi:RNA exonuclease 4 isoform X2 [Drosophila guanche]|uniref:RNA exonuclease 4 n=1 Tax=Drosophila guanche TaxID=7266 RepID=A0A3B0JR10_DROGU|nr:RNA exonuclease 4 isoform X2 [Drosophila guanche]SPP76109.1 blast:RNA exonuclease 4 [Drosophila guanche]